ncbi:hypothetical protein SCHPADRAFT_899878 [Schizopora paradoxa]|uniref:Uncharacterized protein n=1 Tax=Schizopora paradoxa TaxID=27342 RepID=A0A0H2S984_9AGAM|nr:hypothetical protein SCHPADRAFT_899878 [Schizopora paradoxa]
MPQATRRKRFKWNLFRRSSTFPDQISSNASKDTTKSKARSTLRTLSGVASHTFNVARELSDSFGPLKGTVNGVGYAKDVWQTVKRTRNDAFVLQSEIIAFRDQVDDMISDETITTAPIQIVNALICLDEDLNALETTLRLLSKERVRSQILHWKECEARLKSAQSRFRSSRENFLTQCAFGSVLIHKDIVVDSYRNKNVERIVKKKTEIRGARREETIKIFVQFGLFSCDGSMGGPVPEEQVLTMRVREPWPPSWNPLEGSGVIS